jgi:transposase
MPSTDVNLFEETGKGKPVKRKKARSKQVFKPYTQQQPMLLPPSVEELIPANHMVRVVSKTIDGLNIDPLLQTYQGGGTSSYHPLMLVKVLVYAYLSKVYSSRRIAKALREDVNFMWLSGMQRPDFRTINNFRSGRLKEVVDQVFSSMITFCLKNGYVRLEHYYVDGTKIAANANRHSWVWAKNTKRYKQATQETIKGLLRQIDEENRQENLEYGDHDLEELGNDSTITSEMLKEQIARLNTLIDGGKKSSPPAKKALKVLETKQLPKLERYEQQERLLDNRSSYSKTDPEATFFRMKDDQLLPAYNIMMGTENQFIINYSVHQRASETDQFIAHFAKFSSAVGMLPDAVIGDAAYGSEENYQYLFNREIVPYLHYNTYRRERLKKHRHDRFDKDNFEYDSSTDTFHCPQRRPLPFVKPITQTTVNGYSRTSLMYQCTDCSNCPVAALCKTGTGNRTLRRSPQLESYRAKARELLESDTGRTVYAQRAIENESVFGDIKGNQEFTRFRLREKDKVNVEVALLSIAHNTKKIAQTIH